MAEDYTIQAGDCIASLARDRGFLWETIWNHPRNAQLKRTRKDPNVLMVGDVVYVPDLTLKQVPKPTDQAHQFKLKNVPAKLRLRLLRPPKTDQAGQSPSLVSGRAIDNLYEDPSPQPPQPDEPRAGVPYTLEIDGALLRGITDKDGRIEHSIPPNARQGTLMVELGTANELILPLRLGYLNPVSELSGIKQRLANLGLGCGDLSDEPTPEMAAALSIFQERAGLPVTGEVDGATRDRLANLHGS